MIRPVDAAISQGFGENATSKIRPGSPDYWIIEQFGNYQPDGHTGEDYAVPVGTPIRAVTSGTVLHAGNRGGTYLDNEFWIAPGFAGYHYVINHDPAPGFPHGFIGVYAHGKDGGANVRAGHRVTEGQVIGLSGNTGGSTGPHLHFEILPDQFVVNGYMYGRVNPEMLFAHAALAPQSEAIEPIATERPEEWDEMATKEEVREQAAEAVWGVLEGPRGQRALRNIIQKTLWETRSGAGNRNLFDLGNHGVFLLNAIAAKVGGEGISPADIAAAIPPELAKQVADELGKRIAAGQ